MPIRRTGMIVLDDVLATGKHYKCAEWRLREALLGALIGGLLLAHRIFPDLLDQFEARDP